MIPSAGILTQPLRERRGQLGHFEHDLPVGDHHPLDAMCLWLTQANDVTHD
jgi:hypothetical protein